MNIARTWLPCVASLILLSGCATDGDMVRNSKPQASTLEQALTEAGAALAAGEGDKAQGILKTAAFQQMNFNAFLNAQTERELLGNDLLEVKEVMLIPGQRYEMAEKVTREAYFIGVVALFQAPAEHRWRLSFAAADAEKSGITVGLHACAMSVGAGARATTAVNETGTPLAAVRCQ